MNLIIRFGFFVCLVIASVPTDAQSRHIHAKVEPKDKVQFQELVRSDLDLGCVHDDHMHMLVSMDEFAQLRSMGARLEIINRNVYGRGGSWLPEYLSYSEVETQLNDLATNYPNLTELSVIGTSHEGRNIYALKISDNASTDETESEILLIGNHHAREVITPMICMHVAQELLDGYGTDPNYTDWVDNREIWIVPVLNPDGYVYVETADLFWRKNRRDNLDGTFGVDLNRNWGFQWGHDNNGSSANPNSQVYRGIGPFSEPETDALRQLVETREFKVAMTFHSFGNLLLWGPGYKPTNGPDQDILAGFGEVVTNQNSYTVGNPATGTIYITNGDATDWLYHEAGILAFTPEVGSGSDFFNPPANRIPELIEEGSICAWAALEFGDRPGQLAPPGQPAFVAMGATGGDFTLTWTGPTVADTEVAVYRLEEKSGPSVEVDGAENGDANFRLNGWTNSMTRSNGGSFSFYGGDENRVNRICVAREAYVVQPGDQFTFDAWFDIEPDYDYAYAVVSTDGGRSFAALEGSFTTMDDPNGRNTDHGITGNSGGNWEEMSFDLSDYVGQTVWLGFRYSTDGGTLGDGIWIDNVSPVQTFETSTVLSSSINDNQYSVADREPGTYFYTLRGFDAEGDWGYPSEYSVVEVTEQVVVLPSSFTVVRGQYSAGNLEALHESDNEDVSVFRASSDIQSRTVLLVEATSPVESPTAMTIELEGSVFARASVQQTLQLFDYTTGNWETVDSRAASRFADASISIDVTGDLSRFVEVGTNVMNARVRYQSAKQRQVFSSNTDKFVWVIETE